MQEITLNQEQTDVLRDIVERYVDTAADSVVGGGSLVTTAKTVELAGHRLAAAAQIAWLVERGGGGADADMLATLRETAAYLAKCLADDVNEESDRDRRELAIIDGLIAQFTDASMAVRLTVVQRDVLRRAALASAAGYLRDAAEQLGLESSDPDAVGMADAKAVARMVREELDAIDALGWVDESMAAEVAGKRARALAESEIVMGGQA